MNILETLLYAISFILFYPVLAGLTVLSCWVVICLGSFSREYLERKRKSPKVIERYSSTLNKVVQLAQENNQLQNVDIKLESLLQHTELELIKKLDRIKFVIRVGPALGLMGTLIPMGIALSALAQGQLPKMAQSMITAFTTTVVGLACAVVAYLISLVKERWITADMQKLESLTEIAFRNLKQEAQETRELKTEKIEKYGG